MVRRCGPCRSWPKRQVQTGIVAQTQQVLGGADVNDVNGRRIMKQQFSRTSPAHKCTTCTAHDLPSDWRRGDVGRFGGVTPFSWILEAVISLFAHSSGHPQFAFPLDSTRVTVIISLGIAAPIAASCFRLLSTYSPSMGGTISPQ